VCEAPERALSVHFGGIEIGGGQHEQLIIPHGKRGSCRSKVISLTWPEIDDHDGWVQAEAASRSLFTQGYRYMFAALFTSEQYVTSAVQLAAEVAQQHGKKPSDVRIALAVENDPFSLDVREGVVDEAHKHGMKLVIDDKLPRDLNDMSATLTKVKALHPDTLVVSGQRRAQAPRRARSASWPSACHGWVVYRLIVCRVVDRDLFTSLLVTFGLAIVMAQAMNLIFGSEVQTAQSDFGTWVLFDGLVAITQIKVVSLALAVILAAIVIAFMKHSRLGQAIRATAQDTRAARVMGINTDRAYALTFALNGAICGAAGVLISLISPSKA